MHGGVVPLESGSDSTPVKGALTLGHQVTENIVLGIRTQAFRTFIDDVDPACPLSFFSGDRCPLLDRRRTSP